MPNLEWSRLSRMQLGQYAEYYAKMEFTSYGYDVFTSEVDDHGVDFVIKDPQNRFGEVQVKAVRDGGYVFVKKEKFRIAEDSLLCLLIFTDGSLPDVFVIPSTAWLKPNQLLVSHDYGEDKKSVPEWGLNLSKKNTPLLAEYEAKRFFTQS